MILTDAELVEMRVAGRKIAQDAEDRKRANELKMAEAEASVATLDANQIELELTGTFEAIDRAALDDSSDEVWHSEYYRILALQARYRLLRAS